MKQTNHDKILSYLMTIPKGESFYSYDVAKHCGLVSKDVSNFLRFQDNVKNAGMCYKQGVTKWQRV